MGKLSLKLALAIVGFGSYVFSKSEKRIFLMMSWGWGILGRGQSSKWEGCPDSESLPWSIKQLMAHSQRPLWYSLYCFVAIYTDHRIPEAISPECFEEEQR